MDNIGDLLGSVLSDPDAVAKLKETARQLGLDSHASTPAPPSETSHAAAETGSDLLSAVGKLTPLLGKLGEEDDMTRLLHALRPYLSGSRLKKAEEADKIIAVMRVIPLLKETKL